MMPFFRSRRPPAAEDAGGSGGKLLRGRRREPLPTPYSRPRSPSPSTPAPPPPTLLLPSPAPPAGSPKWVLCLISGAGKLISSVFRPNDSSSPATSSSASGYSSSEEDAGHSSHEKEDNYVSTQVQLSNQEENTTELLNGEQRSRAITVMNESKLHIEQLLMKETFSRDEFIRLTKLMQSRVVDSPSLEMGQERTKNENLKRNEDSVIASSTCWGTLSQRKELIESVPSPHSMLNDLSPISPASLTYAPGTHSARVMEAKKWLEDRKSASHSKSDIVCGPCVLNTDMLNSDLFNEVGSPVNLAKSYMRSLPPWQSPSLSSNYINTSAPRKVDRFKDENTNESGNHSLSSFKAFKRNYLSTISLDSPDETRRVRMRSTESVLENPNPKLEETDSDKLFEKETLNVSSSHDQGIEEIIIGYHDPSFVRTVETSNASTNLSPDCVEALHSTETLKLGDETTVSGIPPTTDKVSSISLASEPEAAGKAVILSCQSVLPVVSSLEATDAKIESAPKLDDKKLKAPSNTEDHSAVLGNCQESVGFASGSLEHGDNHLHETKGETAEENKFAKQRDAKDASNSKDDVQASNMHIAEELAGASGVNNTKLNLESGRKLHDGDPLLKGNNGETNGTVNNLSKNGSSAESNTSSELEPVHKDNLSFGCSEKGEKTKGFCEGSNEAVDDKPAVHDADVTGGKSENGTKMKSIERVLTTEPLPYATRYGRKTVVKKKRGRVHR